MIALLSVLILMAAAALFVFKGTGLTVCEVHGKSMLPTIKEESTLLLNPKKTVERFDIVVFQNEGRYVIKRVIGLPGDDVTVLDGNLFVNGTLYKESYIQDAYSEEFREQDFKVRVPEGQYFLLGDNRDGSFDSRNIGMVDKDQFVGTAILVFP